MRRANIPPKLGLKSAHLAQKKDTLHTLGKHYFIPLHLHTIRPSPQVQRMTRGQEGNCKSCRGIMSCSAIIVKDGIE